MSTITNSAELVNTLADYQKKYGATSAQYDLEQACKVKNESRKYANEVEHSTNTGYGAEIIPGTVLNRDFLDVAPKFGTFLPELRGFHGRNMNLSEDVAIIGETTIFKGDAGEWTTGGLYAQVTQGNSLVPTAKVNMTQKKFIGTIDISEQEMRFSNIVDIVANAQQKLAKSAARTMEAWILNGDIVTAGTGNVNSVDGAPASTQYYLKGDGIRKNGIVTNTARSSASVGTITFAQLIALKNLLGDYGTDMTDVIWLFNNQAYNKSLAINEVVQQYINGRTSSVYTGSLPSFLGSNVYTARDLTLTDATGKQSVTPANNTKGTIIALHKDAVQYGFNGGYNIETIMVPSVGIQLRAWYYAGLAIFNDSTILGSTNSTIAVGYNATV